MQPPTIKQMTDQQLALYLETVEPFATPDNPMCYQVFEEAYREGQERGFFEDFQEVHAFDRVFEVVDVIIVGVWQGLQS